MDHSVLVLNGQLML